MIYVKAVDRANNIVIENVVITVDITPPIIQILSPSEGEVIENDTVTIVWNASDNIALAYFLVFVNESTCYSVGLNTSITLTDLSIGNCTVRVRAVDKAGNANDDEVTFEVRYIIGEAMVEFGYESYMVNYTDSITVSVSVLDPNNKPLENVTVYFYLNASGNLISIGSNRTNDKGVAYIRFTANWIPGTYQLVARSENLTYVLGSEAYADLIINPEQTRISIWDVVGKYLDEVLILALCTDDDAEPNPVSGVTIVFSYYNGSEWISLGESTTNESGYALLNAILNIKPESYNLKAEFAGNEYYRGSYGISKLSIEKLYVVIEEPYLEGQYTDTIQLQMTIVDEKGRPYVGDVYLEYSLDGTEWILIGLSSSNENGVVVFDILLDMTPGEYMLRVRTEETEYHIAGESIGELVVHKEQPVISIIELRGTFNYSDEVYVVVNLTDDDGEPIVGKQVYLRLDTYVFNASTNTSGIATISILLLLPPGQYNVSAYVEEDRYYLAAELPEPVSIRVFRENVRIVFTSDTFSSEYTDTVLVKCYVRTDDGEPVRGVRVNFFYYDGENTIPLGNNDTLSDGLVVLLFEANIPVGNYTIIAEFSGNQLYGEARSEATLMINPEKMILLSMHFSKDKIFEGDEVEIEIIVAENDQVVNYVAGASVTITANGEKIADGTTDENGRFVAKWIPKKAGEYELRITVKKEKYLDLHYSVRRRVYSRGPPLLMFAPAIIGIAIATILIAWKKRKKTRERIAEMPEGELEEMEIEPMELE